ncbi:hypothetical protein [Polyangium aurulentum]|uniref:hypothetical protein n=1 Tax=Polyangium aurulentum TaxID=2567896 RepID=UPI0019815F9E|nr:hypothetical protein [Polyangium aurulentum]UQA57944.1 hypothetical protein E8A73_042860 [Polyangium aurulentum]
MNFLEPDSDRAVRAAVDAFLEGSLRPAVAGDAVFETRNSRYRMRDGHLTAATDAKLVGSELVGWLSETSDGQSSVGAWWSPLARAVLLDRRFGRNIVVTSATLMMEVNGVLLEGSDTRPAPSSSRSAPSAMPPSNPNSRPSPYPPSIPKPAGVPNWAQMAVSETPESSAQTSPPPPRSIPINPSTPPPRGTSAPESSQTRPVGSPPPRGRTSVG